MRVKKNNIMGKIESVNVNESEFALASKELCLMPLKKNRITS
jgi:hypothetical protein